MKSNAIRKQDGFVLVVVAGILIVLIGFVALGVDTGALYSARTTAQEVADAAALAGAFTFITDPTAPQPGTATAHAKATAMANTIMGEAILSTDVDVVVSNPRVTVNVHKTRKTFFAKALGIADANIAVTAAAEAGSYATTVLNPRPLFLPNTIVSAMDPCDACTAGEFLIDPSTGSVTDYGRAAIAAGASVSIKPTDPSGPLQPGLFFLVDFNGGAGGSADINGWVDGSIPVSPVTCNSLLEVEDGNKVGLKQGIDSLLGNPPDDTYASPGSYLINGTTSSDTSKGLVTVPIWDTCGSGFCAGGIPTINGHQQVAVLGWALIFIEGMSGSGPGDLLTGRLINLVGCGQGTNQPSGSSVFGFPLRLVRVP